MLTRESCKIMAFNLSTTAYKHFYPRKHSANSHQKLNEILEKFVRRSKTGKLAEVLRFADEGFLRHCVDEAKSVLTIIHCYFITSSELVDCRSGNWETFMTFKEFTMDKFLTKTALLEKKYITCSFHRMQRSRNSIAAMS